MEVLETTCKSHGLRFSYRIAILSGVKAAHILRVKKASDAAIEYHKTTCTESILQSPSAINKGQKSLAKLTSEAVDLKREEVRKRVEKNPKVSSRKQYF